MGTNRISNLFHRLKQIKRSGLGIFITAGDPNIKISQCILNELPTLFLVLVVMLVVFKNNFPTSTATWLIVGLIVFMAISIQFYARYRRLRKESST